jgi:hypothetical protein
VATNDAAGGSDCSEQPVNAALTSDSSGAAATLEKRRKRRSGRARKKPLWRKQDAISSDQEGDHTASDLEAGPEVLSKGPCLSAVSWRPPPLSKRERSENFFFSALNEIRNAEDNTVVFLDVSHCGVTSRKAKTLGMAIREAARKHQLGGIALDLGRNPLNASSLSAFVSALLSDAEQDNAKNLDGLFTVLDFSECDLFDDGKGASSEPEQLVATPLIRLLRSPACSALVRCVLDGSRGLSAESAVRLLEALIAEHDESSGSDQDRTQPSRRAPSPSTPSVATVRPVTNAQSGHVVPRHILQIHNIYPENTIRTLWEKARRLTGEPAPSSSAVALDANHILETSAPVRISQEESRLVFTLGRGDWLIHTDVPRLDPSSEELDPGRVTLDAERSRRSPDSPGRHRQSPTLHPADGAAEPGQEKSNSLSRGDGAAGNAEKWSSSSANTTTGMDQSIGAGPVGKNGVENHQQESTETIGESEDVYDFHQLFEALEQIQDTDNDPGVRAEVNEHLESLGSALDRLLGLEPGPGASPFDVPVSPLGLGTSNTGGLGSLTHRLERPSNGHEDIHLNRERHALEEELPATAEQRQPNRMPPAYDLESSEQRLPFLLRVLVANLSILERGVLALPEPTPRENQLGILIERPASLTRYYYISLLQRLVRARRASIDRALVSSQVLLFAFTMFLDHPWSNCMHTALVAMIEQISEQERWLAPMRTDTACEHPGTLLFSQIWFGDKHALSTKTGHPSYHQREERSVDGSCPTGDIPRCSVLQAIYRGVCADAEWCNRQHHHQQEQQLSRDRQVNESQTSAYSEKRIEVVHLGHLPYLACCLEKIEDLARQHQQVEQALKANPDYQQLLVFDNGRAMALLREIAATKHRELCGPKPERSRSLDGIERPGASVFIDWSSLLNLLKRGQQFS